MFLYCILIIFLIKAWNGMKTYFYCVSNALHALFCNFHCIKTFSDMYRYVILFTCVYITYSAKSILLICLKAVHLNTYMLLKSTSIGLRSSHIIGTLSLCRTTNITATLFHISKINENILNHFYRSQGRL